MFRLDKKAVSKLRSMISETRVDEKLEVYSQFLVLYLSQKLQKVSFEEALINIDDKKVKWASQDVFEEQGNLIEKFKQLSVLSDREWLEVIEELPLFDNRENNVEKTPISIITLVDRLLDIQSEDTIYLIFVPVQVICCHICQ